mgnify:CR=1 FL=1
MVVPVDTLPLFHGIRLSSGDLILGSIQFSMSELP